MTAGYQLRVTDDACSGLRLHLAVCVGECLFELTLGRTWTETHTHLLIYMTDQIHTHCIFTLFKLYPFAAMMVITDGQSSVLSGPV